MELSRRNLLHINLKMEAIEDKLIIALSESVNMSPATALLLRKVNSYNINSAVKLKYTKEIKIQSCGLTSLAPSKTERRTEKVPGLIQVTQLQSLEPGLTINTQENALTSLKR